MDSWSTCEFRAASFSEAPDNSWGTQMHPNALNMEFIEADNSKNSADRNVENLRPVQGKLFATFYVKKPLQFYVLACLLVKSPCVMYCQLTSNKLAINSIGCSCFSFTYNIIEQ